jgi:hypothetical protein
MGIPHTEESSEYHMMPWGGQLLQDENHFDDTSPKSAFHGF